MHFSVGAFDHFVLYNNDTIGGMSGSPGFSDNFSKMVVLHHHGAESEHKCENRGVLACRILDWLKRQVMKPPEGARSR